MRFILVCLAFLSSGAPVWANVSPGSCTGPAPTQAALLSHFSAGAVKATLGTVSLQNFSRTCTPLSGCSAWSEAPVQLSYDAVNQLSCSRVRDNPSHVPVFDFGHRPVPLPAASEVALVLNNTDIELRFTLGNPVANGDHAIVTGKIATFKTNPPAGYSPTAQSEFSFTDFTGMEPPAGWYYDDQAWGRCSVTETNYIAGRFDVAGVTGIQDITSLQWGNHCFEAVYQKQGVVQSDGSYTEAQVHMSSSF